MTKNGEKTLIDRVYELSERTGIDTATIMTTYLMEESKLYTRDVFKDNRTVNYLKKFEDDALKIMERYVDIYYGVKNENRME